MDSLFSFPVGLLHPLQHAGLSRRSPSSPSFQSDCNRSGSLLPPAHSAHNWHQVLLQLAYRRRRGWYGPPVLLKENSCRIISITLPQRPAEVLYFRKTDIPGKEGVKAIRCRESGFKACRCQESDSTRQRAWFCCLNIRLQSVFHRHPSLSDGSDTLGRL